MNHNKDLNTKKLFKNNERFADIFNHTVFGGKKVVNANNLTELNTETLLEKDGKRLSRRERDILKEALVMADDKSVYILLGIENQSTVDVTMPLRSNMYDLLEYEKQVKEYKSSKKRNKKLKLKPVITLVIYWGEKNWYGPHSLLEMMDENVVKHYHEYINDYHMNILIPKEMSEEDIDKFETDMKDIFMILNVRDSYEEMNKLLQERKDIYSKFDKDAVDLIDALTNLDLNEMQEDEEGKVDMCKAIEDMKSISKAEGKKEGIKEGKIEERRMNIKVMYETMKETNPEKSDKEIINILSKAFKETQKYVRSIVL